jgi:DNA-binding NarL/FixJ family response regulator
MSDPTILAMTGDDGGLATLQLGLRAVGGVRLVLTRSMDEACDLLDSAVADLIIVSWNDAAVSYDQMDQLLWVNSTLARPAPILVAHDDYSPEQAVTLFQMGVDEYVGLAEQRDKLPAIICQMLDRTPVIQGKKDVWQTTSGQRRASLSPLPITAATPA